MEERKIKDSQEVSEQELIKKYFISIWIDRVIFLILLIGFILEMNIIINFFNGKGIYLFIILVTLVFVQYFTSYTTFKNQSIGQKIIGVMIRDLNDNKLAKRISCVKRRFLEFSFLKLSSSSFHELEKRTNTSIVLARKNNKTQ